MAYKVVKSIRLNEHLVYEDVRINASDVVGLSTASTTTDPNIISGVVCNSNVFVGAIVKITSGTIVNALADTVSNANWIGMCIEKPGQTCCTIRFPSLSSQVFSTLVEGSDYYLSDSTAGTITTAIPTANNSVLAPVGISFNSQQLSLVRMIKTVRRA